MTAITRRTFLTQASLTGIAAALPYSRQNHATILEHRLANDPRRPQYHLLPAANWMNDPNGPIYYRDRYHMFFQYNPNGAFWGSMHWAHATSPDMVHWKHEPIAIAPTPDSYDRDGVFSGSAILDEDTPTVIYTGVLPPASPSEITLDDGRHKWREVQCLAVAKDPNLRTWQKLPEPIIARPPNLPITGFRDPGVWREGREWLLTLGSGIKGKGGAVLLYESRNLRHWIYRHPLIEGHSNGQAAINAVDNGEMWECPDFFPLGNRHVLLYSAMGKVWWKTGRYRERRFLPEKEGVVDYGSYYAAKTMIDRDGKRILWGWIPETRPESEYKAAGWAGLMSLPRALSIGDNGELRMSPASAVEALRAHHTRIAPTEDHSARRRALSAIRIQDLAGEVIAEFAAGRAFQMRLHGEKGESYAEIAYDPQRRNGELRVNTTTGSLRTDSPVTLRIFVDGSSLEVFANDRTVITARVYAVPRSALQVEVSNPENLRSLDVWQITPISKNRLTS